MCLNAFGAKEYSTDMISLFHTSSNNLTPESVLPLMRSGKQTSDAKFVQRCPPLSSINDQLFNS